MKKIALIAYIAALLMGCGNVVGNSEEVNNGTHLKGTDSTDLPPACAENNSSGDCMLTISNLTYDLPDEKCTAYDLAINLGSEYSAPAGLHSGATSRIDWEFLPDGNAGFWIAPLDEKNGSTSGTVIVEGCFSYGTQDTLKVVHSIADENGNESNSLSVKIVRPEDQAKSKTYLEDFEVIHTTTQ
jgi:hypothetical protein